MDLRLFQQNRPEADIPAHPLFCRYRGKSKHRASPSLSKLDFMSTRPGAAAHAVHCAAVGLIVGLVLCRFFGESASRFVSKPGDGLAAIAEGDVGVRE